MVTSNNSRLSHLWKATSEPLSTAERLRQSSHVLRAQRSVPRAAPHPRAPTRSQPAKLPEARAGATIDRSQPSLARCARAVSSGTARGGARHAVQ